MPDGGREGLGNIFGPFSVPNLDQQNSAMAEPTGFKNSDDTDTTLGFVDGSRTFTITPVGDYFDYWASGTKHRKFAAESVIIPDTDGVHWIYYDGITLTTSITQPGFALVWVARILWDATNNKGLLHNERHKFMPASTHELEHFVEGAKWKEGYGIADYVLDTDSDAAVTFGLDAGKMYDEDILHDQSALADPANMHVFYRAGAGGPWRWDAKTDYAFKNTAAGRVNYNSVAAGTWGQTQATDNYFVAVFICAWNGYVEEFIAIQGQREDQKLVDARLNNTFGGLSLGDLGPEIRPLWRVILRTKDTFGGTRKAKISHVEDIRAQAVPAGATAAAGTHPRLHEIDAITDHVGVAGATVDNLMAFDANGLPKDSGLGSGVSAKIKTGTYTGDGTVAQAITGIGFRPKVLWIYEHISSETNVNCFVKLDQSWADFTFVHTWSPALPEHRSLTNSVNSLDADGFTVDDAGVDGSPNKNGATYDYLALG